MLRARSPSASSGWTSEYCAVARHGPTTRQARRSDTERGCCAWRTASRRRAGLRSFPPPPTSKYYCRGRDQRRAVSTAHSLVLSPSTVSPARRQAAVFFLPPIVRLLGDAELPTGVRDPEALPSFNLHGS